MTSKDSYPAIGSLGAVGDGCTVALVGPDGAVEWFCPRRFDEPLLVWPLFDRVNGGRLRIAPAAAAETIQYVDDSAVLQLRWQTDAGEAVGHIFMPWDGDGITIA